ncbi:Hsp70 protein-domain-containing protein [Tribonema minus]|uniref:Hsp70 protein-domain-containing protein n=1 Tax=Tribonema minus TaxID=303371 RepID=A0A835ZDW5_9STRA|nr:Hsp70 protein-domain-containing protein [Tribonema minus]
MSTGGSGKAASGGAAGDNSPRSANNIKWVCDNPIGFDLGTTNSCIGRIVMSGDKAVAQIIENAGGHATTPSCIAFMPDGSMLYGKHAREEAVQHPKNTIFDVKRIIGRKYSDAAVQKDIAEGIIPFFLKADDNDDDSDEILIQVRDDEFMSPITYTSIFIRHMRELAESKLGGKVTHGVIAVPAHFKDAQRGATLAAAYLGGFQKDCVLLIQEPTAAAFAYGLEKKGSAQNLVFDLGGGTFDVSVVESCNGNCTVKGTAGDMNLGGDNFTVDMVEWCIQEITLRVGAATAEVIKKDPESMALLRDKCEDANHTLSDADRAIINARALWKDDTGKSRDFKIEIKRDIFERRNQLLFDECIVQVSKALKEAGCTADSIDRIVLVGGSTRIPKIRQMLEHNFGNKLSHEVNPDQAVAIGATTFAASLNGQGGSRATLLDVVPLSLSIGHRDGSLSRVIKRNTHYPIKITHKVTTSVDNQIEAAITVYEGERELAANNTLLDTFYLAGITPAPRGETDILVTFAVNEHGILTASAEDTKSKNKTEGHVIKRTNAVSEEKLQELVQQVAEMHPIIANLQQQRDIAEMEVSRLREAMAALHKDVLIAEDAVEYMSQRKDVLGMEMSNLDACVNEITVQRISKQKDLADVTDVLKRAEAEVDSLNVKSQYERSRVGQAQVELMSLTMERLQVHTDIVCMKGEINTLRDVLEQTRASMFAAKHATAYAVDIATPAIPTVIVTPAAATPPAMPKIGTPVTMIPATAAPHTGRHAITNAPRNPTPVAPKPGGPRPFAPQCAAPRPMALPRPMAAKAVATRDGDADVDAARRRTFPKKRVIRTAPHRYRRTQIKGEFAAGEASSTG